MYYVDNFQFFKTELLLTGSKAKLVRTQQSQRDGMPYDGGNGLSVSHTAEPGYGRHP